MTDVDQLEYEVVFGITRLDNFSYFVIRMGVGW
jgi:hypothetical protein